MNLQAETVETLNATSLGRIIRRAARPAVHLVRRMLHPGVPPQLQLTRLNCNGQRTAILHRRTFADYSVIRQCFADRQYDIPRRAHCAMIDNLYQQILASGRQPLIVDCGSNIGASVLWFASHYPRAHVLAVEPAPDNFELLRRTARTWMRTCVSLASQPRMASPASLIQGKEALPTAEFRRARERSPDIQPSNPAEVKITVDLHTFSAEAGHRRRGEDSVRWRLLGDRALPHHHHGTPRLVPSRPSDVARLLSLSRGRRARASYPARKHRLHRLWRRRKCLRATCIEIIINSQPVFAQS